MVVLTSDKNFFEKAKEQSNNTSGGKSLYWAQLTSLTDDQLMTSLSKSFGYHTRTHREVPLWLAQLVITGRSADYSGDSYLKYCDQNNNEVCSIVGWCKKDEDLSTCVSGRCTVEVNFLISALVSKLVDALTGGAAAAEAQNNARTTKGPTTPKRTDTKDIPEGTTC